MKITLNNSFPQDVPDWCDFFNHPNFFNLHKTASSLYFSFLADEKLIGLCHFTQTDDLVYRSPYRGTYGNISFKPNTDLQIKYECVEELISYFKTAGAKKIEIVSEPFSHNLHESSALFNVFLSKGFVISNQEINHTLEVDERSLLEKMMRNNKKRFNKCERENFNFEQITSIAEIELVYQTIKENREAKGYNISMTLKQITDMYTVFPENIYFFKASQNNQIVASSVCIKLNKSVLYVFYWGDKQGYEQYSPVVFLANGIYNFAKTNHFKMLDAGTSSVSGIPNFGVATFKENLGFTMSPKLTFTKFFS